MLAVALVGSAMVSPAGAADPVAPVNQSAPVLAGTPEVGQRLTASPGTWVPEPSSYTYAWLRDGAVISGAESSVYRLAGADREHRISVRVQPGTSGSQVSAVSQETAPVRAGRFTLVQRPAISGVRRWGRTLTARPGSWSPAPVSTRYQWLRSGRAITGATRAKYKLRVADFGKHIQVRVSVRRADYSSAAAISARTRLIDHRVKVRKRFTYSIATRGKITASLQRFAALTAASFADPRGWRSGGYQFRRVARGGNFTVVLANAAKLPSFGYPCSSTWSCRVGRYVIINQTRWQRASPAWNAAGLKLRDYRHMVLNHETGHWLGHRHRSCPGRGKLAPVMMQQSKSRNGCRFNPFPLPSERWSSQ